MKRVMSMLACLVMAVSSMMAQSDKIVGNYSVVRNGVSSKVKVFKHGDGFRAQVTWVDNLKKEDGTLRTDEKNPDKSKRSPKARLLARSRAFFLVCEGGENKQNSLYLLNLIA